MSDTTPGLDVAATRRRRRIRYGFGNTSYLVIVVLLLIWTARLPRHSPLHGVAAVAIAAAWSGASFAMYGHDAWQRHRALLAFATGAAVGITWSIASTVWPVLATAKDRQPAWSLLVTGGAWFMADFCLRVLPNIQSSEDEGT